MSKIPYTLQMVGIARFELATFCPPDKRAKPSCAISRLFYKYTINFAFCKFILWFFSKKSFPDVFFSVSAAEELFRWLESGWFR